MISIIIASRNNYQLDQIKQNIDQTIGVDYEVISYDNTDDGIGICEIYNKCASKAKYENIVFCHDDIIIHTINWGLKLVEILKDKNVGLVGMAGALFKASAPTSWVSIPEDYYRSALNKPNNIKNTTNYSYNEVAVVDGLFLGLKKNIWNEFKFNEKLKGFHIYDIDISYRIFKKNLKIVVPEHFYVEHLSNGTFDKSWLKHSIEWHLGKNLPISLPIIPSRLINKLEAYAYIIYLIKLMKLNMLRDKWVSIFIRITYLKKKIHFRLFKNLILSYYAGRKE